jgi:thiol-disulfide isomerase/thioredoxin
MKNLFLTLALCLSIYQVQAQKTVNFSGQIKNTNPAELIYLGLDGLLLPLKILENGTFSVDGDIQQLPSFVYFAKISKRGKIEQQTPLIWFERDSVEVTLDWSNKSFQVQDLMPFQSTSERIENLKGKSQIEFILKNPNNIPSLYFANKNKEKISIRHLEIFSQGISETNKNNVQFKRIENYLSAKKLEPLKIRNKVKDFKLPNKEGEQVSIIDGSNKTRVIGLFSSGCLFSIASINLLEQLAELNNGKLELITIWDDQTKKTWLNTYQDKKDKITWTNLWDEFGFASTYLNRTSWPTFYVINEEGQLTEIIKGYSKKSAKKLKRIIE